MADDESSGMLHVPVELMPEDPERSKAFTDELMKAFEEPLHWTPEALDAARKAYSDQKLLHEVGHYDRVSDENWKQALDLSVLESQLRQQGDEVGADRARALWKELVGEKEEATDDR